MYQMSGMAGSARQWIAVLLAASAAGGCALAAGQRGDDLCVEPVAALQHQAYDEAVMGRFVALADLEQVAITGQPGHVQLRHFQVSPLLGDCSLKYMVNITRTGVEAALPIGGDWA